MVDLTLNVVPGGPTPAASVLRARQAYLELMGTKTTLDHGIAFCCERIPGHRRGQQFREVMIDTAADLPAAFAAAEAHFAEHDAQCGSWTLAESQSPEAIAPFLAQRGFQRRDAVAFALADWPAPRAHPDVRILPARPMRAAYEACWREAAASLPTDEQTAAVAAAIERLDDHRMDANVALRSGVPAGVGALFQVGDIGYVVDLVVNEAHRRHGVGSALLDHAIALARRLTLRIVCTEVAEANTVAQAFLKKHNFIEGGRLVEFYRENAYSSK